MRIILITALLSLASPAWAEPPIPDFSEGLDHLAKLTLPDMQGASWIKHTPKSYQPYTTNYYFQELKTNLSGSIWKLADDKSSYLDFGSATPLVQENTKNTEEPPPEESPGIFDKMLRNYEKENPEPEKTVKKNDPPPSLAEKDAQKLAAALAKNTVAEEIEEAMEYGNSDVPARILIFAAQLKASGDTKSANLVANAIFAAVSDDSALIDKAISTLADVEYQAAAATFFTSLDWKSYETKIKQLLEKYPRGWNNAPALKLLVSRLEQRSSTPPKPSLPDIPIKPEAIALLDQLLMDGKIDTTSSDEKIAEEYGYDLKRYTPQQRASILAMIRREYATTYGDQTLWLLEVMERDEKSSPIDQLKAMRMDGLIALASIAKDDTLISIPYTSDSGSSYYSYGGSSRSLAEEILTRYNSLSRPASRGEIAISLLASVIPNPSEDSYSSSDISDPDATQAAAIEFWQNHQSKSNIELATIYIQEGSSTQQRYALEYLTSSKDPKAFDAYENAILTSDSPVTHISSVNQYLSKRKAAAKPFAHAYIKILTDNPPSENELNSSQASWEIREAGGLDQYLKKLSVLVGDVSLSKLIASALKKSNETADEENDSNRSPIAALASTIQTIPLDDCMIAFGKAAPKTTDKQWMEICQLLYRRSYHQDRSSESSTEKKSNAPSPEIINLWKPLIAKTDPLPESDAFANIVKAYGAKTTGDASAFILEISVNTSVNYALNDFGQLEGDGAAVMKFIRQRTDAYINSTTPEPWPGDALVSEQRSVEISKKISGLPANEIIPYAQSLPLAERLILMKFVQSIGYHDEDENVDGFSSPSDDESTESSPVPKGLLELRNTIVSLNPIFRSEHNPDLVDPLGIAIGDKINTALLSRLATHLLENAGKTSGTTIALYPAAISLGATIYTSQNKDFSPEKIRASYLPHVASLYTDISDHDAIVVFFGQGIDDIIALKDGKLISVSIDESDTENKKSLDSFDKILAENASTIPMIYMTVLTKKDAEKINKLEEE